MPPVTPTSTAWPAALTGEALLKGDSVRSLELDLAVDDLLEGDGQEFVLRVSMSGGVSSSKPMTFSPKS